MVQILSSRWLIRCSTFSCRDCKSVFISWEICVCSIISWLLNCCCMAAISSRCAFSSRSTRSLSADFAGRCCRNRKINSSTTHRIKNINTYSSIMISATQNMDKYIHTEMLKVLVNLSYCFTVYAFVLDTSRYYSQVLVYSTVVNSRRKPSVHAYKSLVMLLCRI